MSKNKGVMYGSTKSDVPTGDSEAKRYTAEFRKFVNPVLSKEAKEDFLTWASANAFDAVLSRQGSMGRKIAVMRDFKQNTCIATIMERDRQSPNAGLIVSARASDELMAMWRVMYIVEAFFQDNKWEDLVDIRGDEW